MTRAIPLKTCDRHNCARKVRVGLRFCKHHQDKPVSLHMPDDWDVPRLQAQERYAMTQPPERRAWGKEAQRETME